MNLLEQSEEYLLHGREDDLLSCEKNGCVIELKVSQYCLILVTKTVSFPMMVIE